jgi:hypothetical protein
MIYKKALTPGPHTVEIKNSEGIVLPDSTRVVKAQGKLTAISVPDHYIDRGYFLWIDNQQEIELTKSQLRNR